MRLRAASLVVFAIGVSACAAISGLGPYGDGNQSDDMALEAHDSGDAPDSSMGDVIDNDDADAAMPVTDAMNLSDIDIDALAVCGPGQCGGCCMNGMCVGGKSVTTCGVGGALCTDCTGMGGACSAAGACTTPPKEAGPTVTCVAKNCIACIPFDQSGCCKADDTCGCKNNFSGNMSCN